MPLIRAGGRRVHIQEMGTEGPRLVLIHPLGDTLSAWYFTVAPLLARSFRVLLYDLRGHGLTEFASEGYDLRTLSDDLTDVLRAWVGDDPEPVGVAGHSSGATVALRFGLDHPEWTHSVAAVEAPMPPYSVRDNPAVDDPRTAQILAAFPTEEVDVRRGRRRRARALNRKVRLRQDTTFTDDFEAEAGFAEELEGRALPTLLLYGDRSPFLPDGEDLARRVPASRLRVIQGGHLLPLEQRQQVAEILSGFFS